MGKIILASGSPRRREILSQIGVEFEVEISDKEEEYDSTIPADIVKELAMKKAQDIAESHERKDLTVIGADTVVVYEGKILGKPTDKEDAFRMIDMLQGQCHQVYTGVAVLIYEKDGTEQIISHAEETKVFVDPMDEQEIKQYVDTGEPMDKAGGYGIQGRFAAYIGRIEGDYYNVVGLPAAYISRQLKRAGKIKQ